MHRQNLFSDAWDGEYDDAGGGCESSGGRRVPGWKQRCTSGRHTFSNPTEEPVRLLALSAGSAPDVVACPEQGYAWVATRDPDPELLARAGDPGFITRFEIPIE